MRDLFSIIITLAHNCSWNFRCAFGLWKEAVALFCLSWNLLFSQQMQPNLCHIMHFFPMGANNVHYLWKTYNIFALTKTHVLHSLILKASCLCSNWILLTCWEAVGCINLLGDGGGRVYSYLYCRGIFSLLLKITVCLLLPAGQFPKNETVILHQELETSGISFTIGDAQKQFEWFQHLTLMGSERQQRNYPSFGLTMFMLIFIPVPLKPLIIRH